MADEGTTFHFVAGNLRKIAGIPRYALGSLRAATTRRDPSLWVVGSAFGVADGALAVAKAAQRLDPPPRVVWLAGSDAERRAAQRAGLEVANRDGRDGYHLTLRAGVVVVTHGFGDANRYAQGGAVIVHLGHGAPVKNTFLDAPTVTDLGPLARVPGATRAMRWMYRRGTSRISLFPTGSEEFVASLRSGYGIDEAVRVLGDPRADVLFNGTPHELRASSRALIAEKTGAVDAKHLILYAPTWRDGDPDPGVPTADQWRAIDEALARIDALLIVRPHPLGVGSYAGHGDRVRLLPSSVQPESMPLLWGADALITDYSSMLVDFTATGAPFVCFAPDLAHYRERRGLYLNYDDLADGHVCTTWADVLACLETLFTDEDELAKAQAHSRALRARFHRFTDGGSADRVAVAARDLAAERLGVAD